VSQLFLPPPQAKMPGSRGMVSPNNTYLNQVKAVFEPTHEPKRANISSRNFFVSRLQKPRLKKMGCVLTLGILLEKNLSIVSKKTEK